MGRDHRDILYRFCREKNEKKISTRRVRLVVFIRKLSFLPSHIVRRKTAQGVPGG